MTWKTDATRAHRAALRALGSQLTPSMLQETMRLCAQALPAGLLEGIDVARDLAYGPHERHVLDLYTASHADAAARPIVLYVHGGGFVAGGKGGDPSPFGPNIGAWAVRSGFVGVAMNYRLAPEATWPDGADDIAAAVRWLAAHSHEFGGDPDAIFVVGQSAGAMHVADFLRRPPRDDEAVAGAALVSCLYDPGAAADLPMHRAYWGDDLSRWSEMGSVETILDTGIPLFLAIAEFDEPQFSRQAVALAGAWLERRGNYPPLHFLPGQNHLSTVYGVGSDDDVLGPLLHAFVALAAPVAEH
jgi:triacylglycerol lipase